MASSVGWHRELPAVVALAAILVLRRADVATCGRDIVVRLGEYAPASACLLARLAGVPVARALGPPTVEAHQRGCDTAAGAYGGAYGGAYVRVGIAWLRGSGTGWGTPDAMALLLAERASGVLGGLPLALARSRPACRIVGLVGLWLELGAVAFVAPPARLWMAALVVLFTAPTWGTSTRAIGECPVR